MLLKKDRLKEELKELKSVVLPLETLFPNQKEAVDLLKDIFSDGRYSIAICGNKGSGKTTVLKNAIQYLPTGTRVSVQEYCPEIRQDYSNLVFTHDEPDVYVMGEIYCQYNFEEIANYHRPTWFTGHYHNPRELIMSQKTALTREQFKNQSNKTEYFVKLARDKDGARIIDQIIKIRYDSNNKAMYKCCYQAK